ncbi:NepR family anti-sigma factor [Sphingomonas soli]|uniref:NepR family anti-sigma factor n=1 Tax=Sphingomonas soli TaxID=266127 RepID=UPI000A845407|nr:NepR family anti-sigma factor [Sphingomonas soli]
MYRRALALGELVLYRTPERSGVLKGELVVSAKNEKTKPSRSKGGDEAGKPIRNVGDALRQAYDETLSETVPDDLLAILKKLD